MSETQDDTYNKKSSSLEYLTGQIDVWNRTATKKKNTISKWRKRVFMLVLLGTVCGLLSEQVLDLELESLFKSDIPFISVNGLHSALAVLSAIAIALSTFAGTQILSSELEKNQIKARATSEALKVQAFLYVMDAPPYNTDNQEKMLYERIEAIMKEVANATPELEVEYDTKTLRYKLMNVFSFGRIEKERKKKRWIQSFDLNMTFQEYIEERVEGQINGYYLKKAALFQRYINLGNSWSLILGFIGVAVGSVAAFSVGGGVMWIAFFSTAAASIGSYLASNRYEYLMLSYVTTANQLQLLSAKYKSMTVSSIKAQRRFVAETESIFAMEHNAWISESASSADDDDDDIEENK